MECDVASYHVESFNFLVDHGLRLAALDVPPEKFRLANGDAVELKYTSASLGYPVLCRDVVTHDATKVYPAECRQRALTYKAPLKVSVDIRVNSIRLDFCECIIGEVPVMLNSNRCHLKGLTREELLARGEESSEKGGYFICKGTEKVIRLLVANRRNYPLAVIRKSWREKGPLFTEYAIMMRCVRENHSASLLTLHYLENGAISVAIQYRREIFYVPLMYVIKALTNMNDLCIRNRLTSARPNDSFWAGCVTAMLVQCQEDGIINQDSALITLGSRFRVAFDDRIGPWESHAEAARYLLKYCIAIHLDDEIDKFNLLCYMAQKLVTVVRGECASESPDNPQFQEAAVSGHIFLLIIRERLESILHSCRRKIESFSSRKPHTYSMSSSEFLRALGTQKNGELTHSLEYFLATGNLQTKSGLCLQQNNGFTVIAERINHLRFVSHFRAIHRGAFFNEMRTTDVRKLRPEAWGFICPVHTPDGAPCGLLNHLTASTRIVTYYPDQSLLPQLLNEYGVIKHSVMELFSYAEMYPVLVDGNFFGFVPKTKAVYAERQLRAVKCDPLDKRLSYMAEVVFIRESPDPENIQAQYPGLYIFTDPARFMRPVKNLALGRVEYVGTFEQVYLSICVDPVEAEPGVTIHQELHPSCIFSFAANLIPFPDHNQSPRNVYQCQMGKQSMGIPIHSWHTRADNKMYRLQFPQDPLLKLEAYTKYNMEEYPLGTNACVAVISYTGYDMEDAMVINKSSFQRGFAHGTVIKVERLDLSHGERSCSTVFMTDPNRPCKSISPDGLPIEGRLYADGDPYYSTLDLETGLYRIHKYDHTERAFCGLVRIIETTGNIGGKFCALIQWRFQRNPIIGDKFASRHGQKGINSFLWPTESLPFSEGGMVPDIIFNPHGFPSRMTIGMMIESMAGKSAAVNGMTYDASPFVFNEKKTAIEYFGKLLTLAGYNYYGNETMYSGVDGREMEAQIFFGIVYYQRLRHMIADKYQVRSTGPCDPVTKQPVKGRKKGGGIRFGEMERDAMIAHGATFCLQDRLFNCSDRDTSYICKKCGSLISVFKAAKAFIRNERGDNTELCDKSEVQFCHSCRSEKDVEIIQIPHVFSYLVAELAAMNVRTVLSVKSLNDCR